VVQGHKEVLAMEGELGAEIMRDYDPEDPLATLATIIIGSTIAIAVLLSCIGCATTKCPPCVPKVETVQISVPVPSCEPPAVLPMVEYPDWPVLPQNATGDQKRAFYAACVATLNARWKIALEAIKARDLILEAYRE
jgi:hypothetical protein